MEIQIEYVAYIIGILVVVWGLKLFWSRGSRKFSHHELAFFSRKWQEIEHTAHTQPHVAVLESDKLLHLVLKKRGFKGSMGDILKKKPTLLSSLDDVWYAHKIRNRIAHDVGYTLKPHELERIITYYKRSLRDLKALK